MVLLVVTFGTLPFYCLGFFLLATPERSQEDALPTATSFALSAETSSSRRRSSRRFPRPSAHFRP
ncbi:MAG: hypothetical protein IPK52_22475 [Chloroflexi bacterium]|nr:hypothetical protein [Chloroflexota bacterium]